jgi:hypothetical protein
VTGFGGSTAASGSLGLTLLRSDGRGQVVEAAPRWPTIVPSLADVHLYGRPQPGLPLEVNRWRRANGRHLWRGARRVLLAKTLRLPHMYGQLWLSVFRGNGDVLDLGLASLRTVSSFDTTIERAIGVSATWGTSNASNSITTYALTVMIIN